MKEVKNDIIKMRVSASEKEIIKQYALKYNITISELLRLALNRFMTIEESKGEK